MYPPESREQKDRPHYHSHALSRGLTVLRIVAMANDVSTVAQLHASTGFPKSTLVRLISVLEDEEYLARVDDRPAYELGHGLLPLARAYLDKASVIDVLRPHLTALTAATGWTANFGRLEGDEIVHMCVEFPERSIRYSTTEGSRNPAYCTGLGKAIMSRMDDNEVDRALPPEPFPQLTSNTITTSENMNIELREVRNRGYAIDAEESDVGLYCLAVPVITDAGFLGALSISGPAGEATQGREDLLVEELRHAGEKIESIHALPPGLEFNRRPPAALT